MKKLINLTLNQVADIESITLERQEPESIIGPDGTPVAMIYRKEIIKLSQPPEGSMALKRITADWKREHEYKIIDTEND